MTCLHMPNKNFKTFIGHLILHLDDPTEFRALDIKHANTVPSRTMKSIDCSRKGIANVSVHVKYMGMGLWRESFIMKLKLLIVRCCTSTYSSTSILYSETCARKGTIRNSCWHSLPTCVSFTKSANTQILSIVNRFISTLE